MARESPVLLSSFSFSNSNSSSQSINCPFVKLLLLVQVCILLFFVALTTARQQSIYIGRPKSPTTSTSPLPSLEAFAGSHNSSSEGRSIRPIKKQKIVFGAIFPNKYLIKLNRTFKKEISRAVSALVGSKKRKYKFNDYFEIGSALVVPTSSKPTPKEIISNLCEDFLPGKVATILYFTFSDSDTFTGQPAATQYFMQLTAYLGIPVIAWNADNMALAQNQKISRSRVLQLAPTLEHQASAMLSIAKRYSWHTFSMVTSNLSGFKDFVRAVKDHMLSFTDFKFTILDIFTIEKFTKEQIMMQLEKLRSSEARIIMLYSTKSEASEIFEAARHLKLTGKDYMWIASRSVVGANPLKNKALDYFPPGMLGIYLNTTHEALQPEIERAVRVFGHGLELFIEDPQNLNKSLSPELSCNGSGEARWDNGDLFFKYLRNVKIKDNMSSSLEFNVDGTSKFVEFDVMNLNALGHWEKIGELTERGLEVRDITWPGNSTSPPQGVPDRFNLKVTFLEEPPFVNVMPLDKDGKCKVVKAVKCRFASEAAIAGVEKSVAESNPDWYRCCTGFCIDLLEKFSKDLRFSYELYRVEDGAWGMLTVNRTWNGLIADLLNRKADVVATSIKINSDRQAYADFTVPFLETGITILVSKRTGIISPKAFLEPFDTMSWIMILLVSIQLAVIFIFLFEWLSPSGYNMTTKLPKGHKFSFFRTYWLVWAILFGAAVPVNCPKGLTARFMSNVWATFAVVFLAIYTANLAAFMITREDYHAFTGIEDPKLANPYKVDPPLRFGTLPSGNTEAVLKRNKPQMHAYMKKFNQSSSELGVKAVKKGELDAFIYDAVVLDYFTGQDNDCRLLTVGSWYAMTGYGFAFPKKSKYLNKFNEKMIEYRESGDLERLRKFWFVGACKPSKSKGKLSKPLDVNQFMSAFLLLGVGILLTLGILVIEHSYFKFCRKPLSKRFKDGCFRVISLSVAKSFTFDEPKNQYTHHPEKSLYFRGSSSVGPKQIKQNSNQYRYQEFSRQNMKRSRSCSQLDDESPKAIQADLPPPPPLEHCVYAQRNLTPIMQRQDMTHNHISSNDPSFRVNRPNLMYSTLRDRRGKHFQVKANPACNKKASLPEIETVL